MASQDASPASQQEVGVPTRTVTLIGKPGCHLCDDARETVLDVMGAVDDPALVFEEASILDDAALNARFAEEIPVILIDGTVHTYWRVDAERLRSALEPSHSAHN